MRETGLGDFEFSQNYAMSWDKLERANYFLEAVIETADRDLDDRAVAYLLETVANDGGHQRRRPVEHVRRSRGQARPGPQGLHAGDAEFAEHGPDELDPPPSASPGRANRPRGYCRRP